MYLKKMLPLTLLGINLNQLQLFLKERSQPTFTCSKSTIETHEKSMKYVQS